MVNLINLMSSKEEAVYVQQPTQRGDANLDPVAQAGLAEHVAGQTQARQEVAGQLWLG